MSRTFHHNRKLAADMCYIVYACSWRDATKHPTQFELSMQARARNLMSEIPFLFRFKDADYWCSRRPGIKTDRKSKKSGTNKYIKRVTHKIERKIGKYECSEQFKECA